MLPWQRRKTETQERRNVCPAGSKRVAARWNDFSQRHRVFTEQRRFSTGSGQLPPSAAFFKFSTKNHVRGGELFMFRTFRRKRSGGLSGSREEEEKIPVGATQRRGGGAHLSSFRETLEECHAVDLRSRAERLQDQEHGVQVGGTSRGLT